MIKKSALLLVTTLVFFSMMNGSSAGDHSEELKQKAFDWINDNSAILDDTAFKIWGFAELAFEEYRSSELLSGLMEKNGFTVTRNLSGISTAFTAEYGSGKPVIGILGEFDALPGLSQKAGVAEQKPLKAGAEGHGCGHNLLGVAGAGAALAAKAALENSGIQGTVKFFGCPAEEKGGGKVYLARDGYFDDLDVCFDYHPGFFNVVSLYPSQAVNGFYVTFKGKTAHAAGDPWDGRSALDAVELMNLGVNFLREHMKPTAKIHYVITEGGKAPNVVPGRAQVWYFVREADRPDVDQLYKRVLKIAEGAALMTETEFEVFMDEGLYNYIPNRALAEVLQKNLELVGVPEYTEKEQEFARTLQRAFGKKGTGMSSVILPLKEPEPMLGGGGSSDVGNVSWIVPTTPLITACWPNGIYAHTWGNVAAVGHSIGFKGMRTASKVIAASAIDTLLNPAIITTAREEHKKKTGGIKYVSPIPKDRKPIINKKKDK